MIDMLYRKSLKVTSAVRGAFGVGAIVNLQSNDASKIWSLPQYLHVVWNGPFQIIVIMGMLVGGGRRRGWLAPCGARCWRVVLGGRAGGRAGWLAGWRALLNGWAAAAAAAATGAGAGAEEPARRERHAELQCLLPCLTPCLPSPPPLPRCAS
jgi:hypothetical protein